MCFEGKYGGAGGAPCSLHHREPDHGPRRRGTVRAAAKQFGISKSTVHKDISERLPLFNRALYLQVKEVLDVNKAQRHIRGGIATRKKYKGT